MTNETHRFEVAGLGIAPFQFVGSETIWHVAAPGETPRPGSTCDYCGQAIANVFHVKSADARRFHVGSECIQKTGDAGLVRKVAKVVAKARSDKKATRAVSVDAELDALLEAGGALHNLPHPKGFRGKTLFDYATFIRGCAGAAGKAKLLKQIKAVL